MGSFNACELSVQLQNNVGKWVNSRWLTEEDVKPHLPQGIFEIELNRWVGAMRIMPAGSHPKTVALCKLLDASVCVEEPIGREKKPYYWIGTQRAPGLTEVHLTKTKRSREDLERMCANIERAGLILE